MQVLLWLQRAAAVRPGEGRVVGVIAAVFATLEIGRGLGEVGVNTLVLSRLSADALPWLYIPLGLVSMVIAIGYGAALGRVPRARLFAATLIGLAAILAIEWVALAGMPDVIAVAWLTVMAAGSIAATISWTVAGSSLDARQAKRLFPLCTAAAIAGAFLGSLAAGPLAQLLGAPILVVAEALAFVATALLIRWLASFSRAAAWAPPSSTSSSATDDLRVGFDQVRASPLLRLIGLAYVLFAILMFSVTFPFLRAAREAAPSEEALAGTLGVLAAVVAGASFFVSIAIANRFYARFGVAAAAVVLPLVYLGGFGLWIVRFTFPTAATVTVVQQVAQRGLSNAAWSAFYNVVPASRRAQVLAFMDGVPGQLGIILSGVLLLTAGRFLAREQVFWLGLAAAAICLVVVLAIRRRYADELVRTLRSGVGEQILEGGPGLGDLLAAPDVRAALIEALQAPEPATRAFAAAMLARSPAPDARAAVRGAIDDKDPAVRGIAVEAALAAGPDADDPEEPAVRERAETALQELLDGDEHDRVIGLRTLYRLGRGLSIAVRPDVVGDPAPTVRAMCMTVLGTATDRDAVTTLIRALSDPEPLVRRSAAVGLAARSSLEPAVLDVLETGSPDAQDAAIAALDGHGELARDRVLSWASGEAERALELSNARELLARAGRTPSTGGASGFLYDTLGHRMERHESHVLDAMAVLGAPAASGVLRRGLHSTDPDVRAQALEALDSIGDRKLGGAVTRLVEGSAPGSTRNVETDAASLIGRLRDDDDPWIRGLAMQVRPTGGDVADHALADLDTMLKLRRVPLFAQLSPEDLQRVAMVATERSFDDGMIIIREGELAEELYVILDGRVVVTRHENDGSVRRIRTYEAGDHIGELAVLRDRPRAATVTADGPVHTLVVDGGGLRAILRERPDAAMALLATLAQRLSEQ